MPVEWNANQPIYRQLRDMVIEKILDGTFAEGEAIPSVRQVASDYSINHLTVAKAYQQLVEDQLLEKRRGLGMFVLEGARNALVDNEQNRFMQDELPALVERVQVLGLDMQAVTQRLLSLEGKE